MTDDTSALPPYPNPLEDAEAAAQAVVRELQAMSGLPTEEIERRAREVGVHPSFRMADYVLFLLGLVGKRGLVVIGRLWLPPDDETEDALRRMLDLPERAEPSPTVQ
jgi:hypothetical protein